MHLIIQHQVYRELGAAALGRGVQADAEGSGRAEENWSIQRRSDKFPLREPKGPSPGLFLAPR